MSEDDCAAAIGNTVFYQRVQRTCCAVTSQQTGKEEYMKTSFLFFMVMAIAIFFCGIQVSDAQSKGTPPLLVQQAAAQPSFYQAPPSPPAPPSAPPMPDAVSGPPAAPPPPPHPFADLAHSMSVRELLGNLNAAVDTAGRMNGQLSMGRVWTMQLPRGEVDMKAGLMYRGTVVAVLHLNPEDGTVLPMGMPPRVCNTVMDMASIKARLSGVAGQLKVLDMAEFRGPEGSWSFPVVLGNTIVSHLKVYYDGIHIVPDYPADQEMTRYGQ